MAGDVYLDRASILVYTRMTNCDLFDENDMVLVLAWGLSVGLEEGKPQSNWSLCSQEKGKLAKKMLGKELVYNQLNNINFCSGLVIIAGGDITRCTTLRTYTTTTTTHGGGTVVYFSDAFAFISTLIDASM